MTPNPKIPQLYPKNNPIELLTSITFNYNFALSQSKWLTKNKLNYWHYLQTQIQNKIPRNILSEFELANFSRVAKLFN